MKNIPFQLAIIIAFFPIESAAWAQPTQQAVLTGFRKFESKASDEDIEGIAKVWASDFYIEPKKTPQVIGHNWSHGSINGDHERRLDYCAQLLREAEAEARLARLRGLEALIQHTNTTYHDGKFEETVAAVAEYFAEWAKT